MRSYKNSKIVRAFCITTLAALFVTGCNSSGNSKEYVVVNPNKSEQSVEEDKSKNTLTVWCWDPAFNMNAMEKAAEIYKKDHPDFELEIVETQSDELQTKFENAVLSATTENLPDIILLQDRSFQKNVITYPDGFVDLTEVGIDFSKFSSGKLGFSTVDGRNYGVPFDNGAVIACYRTDILQEAGFTIEDFENITWDEFIAEGKVVLQKTGKPLLSFQKGSMDPIIMLLQSAGGGFFNEDGSLCITDNEILKEAMSTYVKMVQEGVLLETTDWNQYIETINQGQVASAINGCWIMASVQAAEEQSGKWAVTNMPRLTNASTATNYANQGGSSWAITSGCDNVELAVDFLGSTFGGSVEFYENILSSGAISCYLPAGDSEKYGEKNAFFSNDSVYSKIIDYAGQIPACTTGVYFNEAGDAVGIAMSNMLEGADMESQLKEVETKMKEVLEQ